ncbi:ribose 5-phosphate isomerase B [Marinilabilia rubra]|uniref:Ribose 5-phosphate isomerase B n=1 Tax=Marinilabilia rubra TaxID=2162893 RepID=A0A2U2BAW3_9BACT|nr:ribose 5-phosphate isomerase B [Marinilabilia rubra]PWE00199.1 ribose 5-phosphate isomerase B [Marinilabilia rubra]
MGKTIIGIASDHAGYEMKETAKAYLEAKGYGVKDFGTDSPESTDYTDYAHPLGHAISDGELERAIAFCGSGNGISITLNRHNGVRAAYCWNAEISRMGRLHNDANICAMPARFLETDQVYEIIDAFLETGFEGGRHQRRIDKIDL